MRTFLLIQLGLGYGVPLQPTLSRKEKYQGLREYYVETNHDITFEDNLDETVEQRMDFEPQNAAPFPDGPTEPDMIAGENSGDSTDGSDHESESSSDDSEGGPGPSVKGEGSKSKKPRREASEERCGEDRGLGPKPKPKKVIIATIHQIFI